MRVPQVLSLFFTLEKGARDLGHLHELFRQVMTRLIAEDKEVLDMFIVCRNTAACSGGLKSEQMNIPPAHLLVWDDRSGRFVC